jgi:hypothetical protein
MLTEGGSHIGPQTEKASQQPFRVFLPGSGSHGRELTGIRSALDTTYGADSSFVPSSIDSIYSRKTGESFSDYYSRMAQEIAVKAGAKDVVIVAHSLGTVEAIDVLNALLDSSWKGKKIQVELASPIGYQGKGTKNVWETSVQSLSIFDYLVTEQHMAYPLPERYYDSYPNSSVPGTRVIFEDSPGNRKERKSRFKDMLAATTPDPDERQGLFSQVEELDQKKVKLISEGNDPHAEYLLYQRKEALYPYVEKLFRGLHHADDLHRQYQERYGEFLGSSLRGRARTINTLVSRLRTLAAFHNGLTKSLARIVEKAKHKEKELSVSFVFLERDELSPVAKLPGIRKEVKRHKLDGLINDWKLLKQYSHPGIAVWTEGLVDIFESAK